MWLLVGLNLWWWAQVTLGLCSPLLLGWIARLVVLRVARLLLHRVVQWCVGLVTLRLLWWVVRLWVSMLLYRRVVVVVVRVHGRIIVIGIIQGNILPVRKHTVGRRMRDMTVIYV